MAASLISSGSCGHTAAWDSRRTLRGLAIGLADLPLVAGLPNAGRFGMSAQCAHWHAHGRFPDDEVGLPLTVVRRIGTAERRLLDELMDGAVEVPGRPGC